MGAAAPRPTHRSVPSVFALHAAARTDVYKRQTLNALCRPCRQHIHILVGIDIIAEVDTVPLTEHLRCTEAQTLSLIHILLFYDDIKYGADNFIISPGDNITAFGSAVSGSGKVTTELYGIY